ncbi:MAG: gliding motility protein GldC [Chitinophagaceae bacterium]|jgi:gliding motility-associated protein GldC|nr:gliding motility protein GldC [Chitinophagaceae bacterium]OQY92723.1 MAG: gliding motility protein GldC [Sphingobacteriales bacterium UTBCD1]
MSKSTITVDVTLDNNRTPQTIEWTASDVSHDDVRHARAMLLSFWDGEDKTALRIDLWTKDMLVEEMADFFYQTFMTMADTYSRATRYNDEADEIKKFAKDFLNKFQQKQAQQSKV